MNTFIESNKGKHFTLSDRISIEAGIEKGWSFKKIADELGKSPSSVSREVRRHLIFSPHYYDYRSRRKTECIYFSSCSKQGVCGNLSCSSLCSKCRSRKCASFCPSFTTAKCELLKKPPYVCNACPKLRRCSHDFFFYRAKHSHDTSLELRSSSRSGINLSPEELDQLDRLVSPLIKKASRFLISFFLIWKIFPAVSVLFIPTWISNIFLLSTLIFPEKSATKNVKRNSLIHRFPDIERTVLTEISWIFLLLPPILQ